MSSPLEDIAAVRELNFNVYLSRELEKFDRVNCILGDNLRLVFTVYRDKDAQGDLGDGFTATFTAARVGKYGPDTAATITATSGADIELDGAQAIVSIDTDEFEIAGQYYCQLRLTKDGNTITATHGYINAGILTE